ncbi:MAG: helix-turn-helix transcriptional regulator [Alphaproteobacteria bacterium]|nr:helix-turn-helix transcriptional regulator [Alphaproteobacteria bacterium]
MIENTENEHLMADLQASAGEAAALMKTLSNTARLMILCQLVEGERSVAELEKNLDTKQPNVSQQLARLRMEGYVAPRRDGRTIYYSLADERVAKVIRNLHQTFCPR